MEGQKGQHEKKRNRVVFVNVGQDDERRARSVEVEIKEDSN